MDKHSSAQLNACLPRFLAQVAVGVCHEMWSDRTDSGGASKVVGCRSRNRPTVLSLTISAYLATNLWYSVASHRPTARETVYLARLITISGASAITWLPSRPSSSMISFACRGSGDIRIPPSVNWALRLIMTISLASVGLAPIICFLSHSAFVETSVLHQQLISDLLARYRRHALLPHHFPAWRLEGTPRHLSHHHPSRCDSGGPFQRCHDLAPCLVPYTQCRHQALKFWFL